MRALLALLVFAAAVLAGGCPRDVQDPEPGESAEPCATLADCNLGRTCSDEPMRACVDRLCEAEPSLVIACHP